MRNSPTGLATTKYFRLHGAQAKPLPLSYLKSLAVAPCSTKRLLFSCWPFSANTESSSKTHASAAMQTDGGCFLNPALLVAANCFFSKKRRRVVFHSIKKKKTEIIQNSHLTGGQIQTY
jgi:hypothetical protein